MCCANIEANLRNFERMLDFVIKIIVLTDENYYYLLSLFFRKVLDFIYFCVI